MYPLMSQKLHRRSVLIGLGSAAVIGSASGAGTTAAELSEATQLSGDLSSAIEPTEFVTTTDPDPTAAAEAPIPTTTDSASEVVVSESSETALTASIPDAGSVESGSTIDLWAGKVDTAVEGGPSGVADEELTIEVTRPDDETEEFTETTDENGSVSVEYSIPENVAGQYQATIAGTDDFDASVWFNVGPVLESTGQSGRLRPVLTGDDATFGLLLLDGQEPIADETVTITVNDADDGSTLDEETVTTGADGFAEITVEASETGEHVLEATATVDGVELSATESYPVSEIGYEYDFFRLNDTLAGREAAQGGRIWAGDGPLADTEIELQYSNEEADVEITETATTDENGFFAVRFEAPTDVDHLDVALETTDGRAAALGTFEDSVDVNEPDIEDPEAEAEVNADFEEFRIAPGETTPLNVSATDADGDPIADATVNVGVRFGWSGDGAPLRFTSVETDADGEATLDIEVPENVPDNSRLNAALTLDREEDTLTDDDDISVQSVVSGTSETFEDGELEITLDATETATDDPVEEYNTYIDAQYVSGRTGSVLRDRLLSDTDGSDTTSVAIPEDASYMLGFNYLSETDGNGGFLVQIGPYPGHLSSGLESGEAIEPGTELPLEYEVEADTASGLVYGSIGDVPIAATFDTAEAEPSIPIPEDVVDDSARVRVWAVGSDGAPYSGATSVSVDPDAEPEPTAEFSVTDLEPETATLEAGEGLSVSATVTNTGDASGTGTAEVLLDDDVQATVDLDLDVDATEDIAETIETDDLESGEYTYAIETDDDSGSGTLQIETPEDELPEEGEHESGVDQELFDAVDRDGDGELDRGDVRNMINQYAQSGEVDGVPLNRGDVRDLINFYALQ